MEYPERWGRDMTEEHGCVTRHPNLWRFIAVPSAKAKGRRVPAFWWCDGLAA